uniref:Uncharacterized protein n=1 Tax=Anguilla anguilla TaxID=7936 RepID=A0A0E9PS64_ANGAN
MGSLINRSASAPFTSFCFHVIFHLL